MNVDEHISDERHKELAGKVLEETTIGDTIAGFTVTDIVETKTKKEVFVDEVDTGYKFVVTVKKSKID